MSCHFLQGNAVSKAILNPGRKHSQPFPYPLLIQRDQVAQAGPAFHKSMLAGPDNLVVLGISYRDNQTSESESGEVFKEIKHFMDTF